MPAASLIVTVSETALPEISSSTVTFSIERVSVSSSVIVTVEVVCEPRV